MAGISGVGRGRSPAGEGQPKAFPGRAWKTRAEAACSRVCPNPEEPVIGPPVISPSAAQLWHFCSPQECQSATGRVATTTSYWVQPQRLHLRAVRPHMSPGRAGKASDLQPSPFLHRKAGTERGRNLPRACSKSMAQHGDWAQHAVCSLLHCSGPGVLGVYVHQKLALH